jgi:hypothetical protein
MKSSMDPFLLPYVERAPAVAWRVVIEDTTIVIEAEEVAFCARTFVVGTTPVFDRIV